jgi:hypothetical protein
MTHLLVEVETVDRRTADADIRPCRFGGFKPSRELRHTFANIELAPQARIVLGLRPLPLLDPGR